MANKLPFYLDTKNPLSPEVEALFEETFQNVKLMHHEYLTPEHLLLQLLEMKNFVDALILVGGDITTMKQSLTEYLDQLDKVSEDIEYSPSPSYQLMQLMSLADARTLSCGKPSIEIIHVISEIANLEESTAGYLLSKIIRGEEGYFLNAFMGDIDIELTHYEDFEDDLSDDLFLSPKKEKDWKEMVVCINDIYQNFNPLIGREDELKKTIRVLCRKEKNNPLHLGEPGVGKTALVNGLAKMIEEGKVPDKLKGSKIYRLDLGNLIAGTQYRGDFEKRIKKIMDGVVKEENAIIYIDEIHNLVGAGATGEGSLDASNFLKSYLERGEIKFIGATTYDEYRRYFAKNKSILRRFTNIDIPEPSIEETIHILKQLQPYYELFHNVKYTEDAIDYAVIGSAKYLNDRFLPDKAIDLLDESGAELQVNENSNLQKTVDKKLVSEVLAKLCKVETLAITEKDSRDLEHLEERISLQLFGQPQAVSEVTEAVLMSKAGMKDEDKPIASLLFVGPTGVGKTELAKLLAKELGVELLRFDMSEYTEKHTIAKLIGSPAGYVGYEDGGLLTDAIRKTPHTVLLLDEIEKAHTDIYNILLQVMDYAKLTDNKGNKADFRNVVLIMTSNAGAEYASNANVGFNSSVSQGNAMLRQVKKTFKPEFLNRLSATVVFNDMNKEMASEILEKKLNIFSSKLEKKNVKLNVSQEAKDFLLVKGFTREYGARELDRVIHKELKKLLTKEILFGYLKQGGEAKVKLKNDKLVLCLK